MSIFDRNPVLKLNKFQKRLIVDYKKRVFRIKEHKLQISLLKESVTKEKIDLLKREVLSFIREIKFEDEVIREFENSPNEIKIFETDLLRLRKQASVLPLGNARNELILFLGLLEEYQEPINRLTKLNDYASGILIKLENIIKKEITTFEGEYNLLIAIEVKEYQGVDKEIEELKWLIESILLNLTKEEEMIIRPLEALLDQKKIVQEQIELLKTHFNANEKNELDLEKIKKDIRSLNPVQAKEYLELLQDLINHYYRKSVNLNRLKRSVRFLGLLKTIFARKSEAIAEMKELQSVRELSETEKRVRIDSLTGLKNRTAFNEELLKKIKTLFRKGGTLGFFMMDIDHFKSINDTWGHLVGDLVIQNVANAIKEIVRFEDNIYRLGGEEFAAIMSNGPVERDLLIVGERLRILVTNKIEEEKRRNTELNKMQERKVQISIGAVCVSCEKSELVKNGEFFEEISKKIYKAADDQLYIAKNNGRNQVRISRIDI